MLAETVEFLNRFKSLQKQDVLECVFKCRAFLGRLVETYLSDMGEVSATIKKDGANSMSYAPLQFCRIFLREHTEVLLPAAPSQTASTPPLSRPSDGDDEEELTQIFLLWFLGRILALLGHHQCSELHPRALEQVQNILVMIRWRDAYLYGRILQELVYVISDLVQISEEFQNGQTSPKCVERFTVPLEKLLKSIQKPEQRSTPSEVTISHAKFDVTSPEDCELMQLNFTKILSQVSSDLSKFCDISMVNVLWASLCCHLECGDAALKTESLLLLCTMMEHQQVPVEVEDYFIDCVTALLDLLTEGCGNTDESAVEELERATAKLYACLVARGNSKHFLLNYPTTLCTILSKMASILNANGLSHLKTTEIRCAISDLVCEMQDQLSARYLLSPVCKPQRNQLISVLLGEIGCNCNLQYVVGPLVKSIMGELSLQNVDKLLEAGTTELYQDSSGTPKLGKMARKRKLEDTSSKLSHVSRYSHTYKVLKTTLQRLLQEDIKDNWRARIDGVQICVEIITSCIAMYHIQPAYKPLCGVFGKMSPWLEAECCQDICGFLFRLLISLLPVADGNVTMVNECVSSAVRCVGALVSVQDGIDYDPDLYQTYGWVTSLPWLLNDPSWIDLKPANSRDVLKISSKLVEHLEPSTISHCLRVLALLSKEVAPKWRVHVFKMALGDSNIQVKQAAIEAFPILLYQLGPNANHLVYDVIHPHLEDNVADLQPILATIPGPLACVVSRKAILKRCELISPKESLYNRLSLECTACDVMACTGHVGSPRERPRLLDANMFTPFLSLVHSTQVLVKQALIKSMRRMFGHIGVRKNSAVTIQALNMALTFIQDPNYNVRLAFSEVIQYLLGDAAGDRAEGTEGTGELILTKLREAFCRAQKEGNNRLQETILLSIAQLGRVSEGELLMYVIIHLLESMLSPVPIVAAVAYEQLKNIADHKKTKTQNLFMRCRHDVCKFLVEAMHDAQMGKMGKSAEDILMEVSKVLGFPDIKSFLSGTEKYIVPYLVSKGTPAASSLIKLIATQLSVASRSKLLINNTKYVFSYLVRYKQKEADLQTAIMYLQKETNFELSNLVRINFQRVHNELLLHLSTNYSQVFHGLKILSTYDEQYTGGPITSSEEMSVYLQPRLLGVLAHFDSQLLNYNVPMEEKRPALESLISIIRLMGSKIISGIRHKVMNTLRIGLQFTDRAFIEISCRAWNCFVRSLELPFLGQMLAQIVATLLPLLKQLPKQVAEIFNYMIVENRKELKCHFHDIYFLPEMPELSDANAVLKRMSDGSLSQSDFKTRLEHSMKGIQHDSLDVRLHALSKLKKLLKEEKQAFFQLVMDNETADPAVSQLVSLLLKGCREPDPRAQRLYVECLGHCGAIDPGRLELSTNNPKAEMAKFQSSIQDANFAVAVINEVVKSYLAATEPRIQDCSAYALQELLAIYKISESSSEEHGYKLWRRFPEHIQEILIPLLTSRYILATDHDWSSLQKPIYCSKKGHSFKDWVSTWTGYLSSKVKVDSKPWRVFKSCSAVIKFDLHIALYLLPYVVLHVLQDGSQDDIDEICSEINEVLTQVTRTDGKQKGSANFHHMSAQTISSVLDYLTKWKHFRAQLKAAEAPMTKGTASYLSDYGYKTVNEFLERIPQDKLANASFSCKAYTRSLMHYELYLKDKTQLSKEELDFMQRLYVELDETDGVVGVAAIRQGPPSLQEQILTYSGRSGCQIDLQACYEQAIQIEPEDVAHHQGLLRCLMDLGHPSQALLHSNGIIAKRRAWSPQLLSYQVEAAYKLSNWTELASYIKGDKSSKSLIGRLLLAAKAKKEEEFLNLLQVARQEQVGPLSAASMEMGSYQRGYECIVKLHTLTEIEEHMHMYMNFLTPAGSRDSGASPEDLTVQWQDRLRVTQSSFKIQESVLSMRRTVLTLAQQEHGLEVDRAIGQSWLKSAKIAQKTGYHQTAYSFLLQASEYKLPEVCLQKTKWYWEKGEHDLALTLLKKEMEVHFSNVSQLKEDKSEVGKAKLQVYAKALLLYGRYSEETAKMESNAIVKQYREVIEFAPNWEDGYFYLGKYFDRIMITLVDDKDDVSKQGEFVVHVVKNLGQSLRHGNQFIYQSLPRLLSLWLDFGSSVVEQEERVKKPGTSVTTSSSVMQKNRNNLAKLNNMINTLGKNLAPYQLFSAFSQLISRICHAHTDVFLQLKAIIARLLVSYPKQALWLLMGVSKSSYQIRAKRCREIFETAKGLAPDLQKVITDYIKLTERLLELCEKVVKGSHTVSLTQHFRPLKRLLDDSSFSQILVPLQSSMTVILPNSKDAGKQQQHNPFPGNFVYIKGFNDVIEILPSLQKPKKITMHGSDGRLYVMMCKPNDDLRKDCRLMEFNGIVNKFLRKDPESRKRSLHIRTYTVIPLNEECGLLEWVNNTCGLRQIIIKLYKEKGMYTSVSTLQQMQPQLKSPLETKLAIYKQKFLPLHPPIFGEWFLRTFPDPTSWFNARLAYAKTVAVMSVIGYILGLGDRHGENILFDSTNGDCVHVDFNCLFNRGETFEWPEKVPFRMTRNLVHAMGPLKLEGIYRQACEVTLRVMRKEIDPLMSVLKPFVYDPLVEWSKGSRGQRENPSVSGEITNEQARAHVQNIEQRLRGRLNRGSKRSGLDLSVEGHVNYLIHEATDENNLCQMYIGWAAYL